MSVNPVAQMDAEPLLNTSLRIQNRRSADVSRALHLLRRTARLIGFAAFCGMLGASSTLMANDASVRVERLQRWSDLTAPSADVTPMQSLPPMLPVEGATPGDLRDTFDSPRSHGRRHAAIDILAPRNTPVVAAVDGEIRKLATGAAGGLMIYQFDESESHVYYYAHLERYRQGLRERTFVRRGEIIGYVGTSGNADTPHLHFAIGKLPASKEWWKGAPVDPYPLLVESSSIEVGASAPASGE